jgi:predicted transcriptional regulator
MVFRDHATKSGTCCHPGESRDPVPLKGGNYVLQRTDVMGMVKEMPETLDAEELMYRFYLWKKIQAGESDIRAGRVKSHDQVMKESAKWGRLRDY